jgi:parallel beta-helix repeat protein
MKEVIKKDKFSFVTKGLVTAIVLIALLVLLTAGASATTIYVPEGGNQTIQQAVNNATEYDEIVVRDAYTGTTENIVVNKAHLSIRSENGSTSTTVSAKDNLHSVVHITADYVNISGFTIRDSNVYGIYIDPANYSRISDNTITSTGGIGLGSSYSVTFTNNTVTANNLGLYLAVGGDHIITNNTFSYNEDPFQLYGSKNNTIINNTITANTDMGIFLDPTSTNNTLTNNTVSNNSLHGIWLEGPSNNLTGNNASYNQRAGIYIQTSSNNTITGGTVRNNSYNPSDSKDAGITILAASDNNTITGVSIFNNSQNGIYLEANNTNISSNNLWNNTWSGINLTSASNNTLTDNTANNNTYYGIWLDASCNNTLTGNTASNNNGEGIYLESSSNNTIYNNYFNNTNNVGFSGTIGSNTWNTTMTSGVNVAGGLYLGGNFWAYPNGTGFSQTCIDADFDGICDSSYSLASGNVDYLPLSTKRRLIVNKTAPACTVGHSYHTTIQAAIDNASAGDGIIICAGTYTESITVNKAVTLTAFNKSSYDVTVQAEPSKDAITVSADHVNISWLKVQNALDKAYLEGISVNTFDYANLSYNWVTSSKTNWTNYGIHLISSNNNTLIGNTVDNKTHGIWLVSSSNNNLTGNTANSNSAGSGIYLESASNNNNLTGNTANSNGNGIYLDASNNNNLTGNTANSNSAYGIRLYSAGNNNIYNNYFNNTNNFEFDFTGSPLANNTWNTTQTLGTNIVNGPNLGGNYWAKPSGTGFSQTCTDADHDGICDTSYSLTSNNTDYLPLAIWSVSPPPNITSWSNSKTNSNATSLTISTSESVYFNATANQTITNWHWYTDDVYQNWNYDNITLDWSTAGSKTVAVRATNAINGTSETVTWTVLVLPTITYGIGGGAPPAPSINVPVDPATGAVTSTTTLTGDGATLTIPEGTIIIKDAQGNPLSTSIIMLSTATTAGRVGAILTFEFGPSGITFEPPIDLVIAYDPADLPEGVSESELVIRMWDGTTWIDLETSIDTAAHTATAKVSHFTVFALFAAPPRAAPPTPTPVVTPAATPAVTPSSTPTPPFPPLMLPPFPVVIVIVIGLVAAVIIVSVAYMALRRRR